MKNIDWHERLFHVQALRLKDWRHYAEGRKHYSWTLAHDLDYGLAYNTMPMRESVTPSVGEMAASNAEERFNELIDRMAESSHCKGLDGELVRDYLATTRYDDKTAGNWIHIKPSEDEDGGEAGRRHSTVVLKLGLPEGQHFAVISCKWGEYGYEWEGDSVFNAIQMSRTQWTPKHGDYYQNNFLETPSYLPWRGDRTRSSYIHEASILRPSKGNAHNSAYHGKHLESRCILSQQNVVDKLLKDIGYFYSVPHMVEFGDGYAACLSVFASTGQCFRLLMNAFDKENLKRLSICRENLCDWACIIAAENSGAL